MGDCDAGLGIQWLLNLGSILWDFAKLTMSFQFNEKSVQLKCLVSPTTDMVDNQEISSVMKGSLKDIWLQLMDATVIEFSNEIQPVVMSLLNKYYRVFVEPQGLPPQRTQDHWIPKKCECEAL